jgi:hypothetical protein
MTVQKPILNPPIDYTKIGQDQAKAAQTQQAPETVGTIETGLISVSPPADAAAAADATDDNAEAETTEHTSTRGRRR